MTVAHTLSSFASYGVITMKIFYSLIFLLISAPVLWSQEVLQWKTIANSLESPWEITWGPDGWLWYTQRDGTIGKVHPDTQERVTIATIEDVATFREVGLLGMAVIGKSFTRVYLFYASKQHQDFRVVRYRYDGQSLLDRTDILTGIPLGSADKGNLAFIGGRLKVVGDKLFVTTGEMVVGPSKAQDHRSMAGKILRMNLDGTVPEDNPWANAPHPSNLIWATGNFRPQGLTWFSDSLIYMSDRGGSIDSEVNILEKGGNYGASRVFGNCDVQELEFCADSNVIEPIYSWLPILPQALDVASIAYYNSEAIPFLKNSLILTSFVEGDVRQLKLSEDGRTVEKETVLFKNNWGQLRDVCVSPSGRVFIATNNYEGEGVPRPGDDRIIELYIPPPTISAPILEDSLLCDEDTISVQFTIDGEFQPENEFWLELSDVDGNFDNGYTLGSIGNDKREFRQFLRVFPPGEDPNKLTYRFRITSTRPRVVSDTSWNVAVLKSVVVDAEPRFSKICGGGDSLVITAEVSYRSTDNISFNWSTGDTTSSIVVRKPGVYHVVATDANGCSWVDARSMISQATVPEVVINADRLSMCEGDSLELSANGFGGIEYRWSTGEQGQSIVVKEGGGYWVEAISEDGCETRSEEVLVSVVPNPTKPEITRQGSMLLSSEADFYQWYKGEEPIPGATGRQYDVMTSGVYWVRVRNATGCESSSDPISMQVSSVDKEAATTHGLTIHPHPVNDRLTVTFGEVLNGSFLITLSDLQGSEKLRVEKAIHGEQQLSLSLDGFAPGSYLLRVQSVEASAGQDWQRTFIKR